jgi:prevent-host-death family protein
MRVRARTVTVTDFKAKCLRMVEELASEGLVLTKRGQPIARVTPISATDNRALIGSMKGRIEVRGDLFSTGVKWHAES